MKLSKEMFTLSKEEEQTSMMMYGKIIKCLVAPYHSTGDIEIEYDPHTYFFPEKEVSSIQCQKMISAIANNPTITEARIITTNINIIRDMVDGCVRVLTEMDTIIQSPEKTFCANHHTIIHCLLENRDHQKTEKEKSQNNEMINHIIARLNEACESRSSRDNKKLKPLSKAEYLDFKIKIDIIGEQIIRTKLRGMLHDAVTE